MGHRLITSTVRKNSYSYFVDPFSHLEMGLMAAPLPLVFCGMKVLPPSAEEAYATAWTLGRLCHAVPTYLWNVDKMEFAF